MDIGVPLRDLGPVDVSRLAKKALALSEEDWTRRPLRRAVFAGGPHSAADGIVLRHEWIPEYSKHGYKSLHHAIADWCKRNGVSAVGMLPVLEERTNAVWVYSFNDWLIWQHLVWPIAVKVAAALSDQHPRGIMNRAALVRLKPGGEIPQHMDGQRLAEQTHRIHVPLSDCPDCVYTIGGVEHRMSVGRAYDFNNQYEHAVANRGSSHRINLMLEYFPDPDWVTPAPVFFGWNIISEAMGEPTIDRD